MSPSNSRQPRVRGPSLKREKHLHRKCFLWWRRGELRHKGRVAKMRCVWEGGSDTSRTVGMGESVGCAAAEPARTDKSHACVQEKRAKRHA